MHLAPEPGSWHNLLLGRDAHSLHRQLPRHSRPAPDRERSVPHQAAARETLQKYIQRFNNARLKIPKVTEEAIISAFSNGVCDIKMKEELAIHEDLCTSLELFNLATKCARTEEGRLSLLKLPAADPEEKKSRPRI